MADSFSSSMPGLSSPGANAFAVIGNDGTDLINATRGIYVGGAGDVKVTTVGGSTVTFAAVPAGGVLPVRAVRIFATGTTATNLIGMY